VIKKDGSRETFDKEKIRRGVMRACEKRPVDSDKIEKIIDAVEREMLKKESGEVTSKMVGNAVLKRLKTIDKVAYVRFASVYLDFDAIDSFVGLVKEIK
jgi:transcriptional repressor NrdR